jgi:recombination protein RecA
VSPTKSQPKTKAQELADLVNGALGKGTISLASDKDYEVTYTSTGLLPFDILLQGGMPRGRFVEIIGDYSTLKSYLGLCITREVQRNGGTAAIIDTEHAFDPSWAEQVGVDLDNLIVERPANGELAMDIMEAMITAGIDHITVDSIAATLPQDEQTKRFYGEKIQPGRQAALMSAGLRKVTAANSKTSILWINQTRQKIGITFGSNLSVPGGKAMPYYASYRVEMRKVGKETRDARFYDGEKWVKGKEQIGQKFKAEVLKSKLSKPFREIWFTWSLENNQIDMPTFLVSQGLENDLVKVTGNTWTYGGKKAVGRENFKNVLASSPDLMNRLEGDIRDAYGLPQMQTNVPVEAVESAEAETPKKKPTRRRVKK